MNERNVYLAAMVLIVALSFTVVKSCSMRNQRDSALALAAGRDSLVTVSETIKESIASELKNERQLKAEIERKVPELNDRIDELNADRFAFIETIAELENIITGGSARIDTVTVVIEDSVYIAQRVSFGPLDTLGVVVSGYTQTVPASYHINLKRKPIPFYITLSQLKSKAWITDIEAPPYVNITDIQTAIVPYGQGWFARNKFLIGVCTGIVSTAVIVSLVK